MMDESHQSSDKTSFILFYVLFCIVFGSPLIIHGKAFVVIFKYSNKLKCQFHTKSTLVKCE